MRCLLDSYVESVLLKALRVLEAIIVVSETIELTGKEHLLELLRSYFLLCLALLLTTMVKNSIVQSSCRILRLTKISQYKQDSFTDYYDSYIFA